MMRDARMRSAFPARSPGTLAPVFTAEQRNALRDRLLWLAEQDERVVAAAAVGSLAVDAGDRFSDLDLTFGIEDGTPVAHVLDDWTRTLVGDLDAVHLADLEHDPTTYRVFLLPDALQVDLSMTPAARFRPAGPRFRLLFGDTAPGDAITVRPPDAGDLFGWGVVYAVHARGYDDLPAATLARFHDAHVTAVEPQALRGALTASVRALLHEGGAARLPQADTVARRLADLSG